jgi:uncharacterized MnhB-related membrane protein
VTKKSSKIFLIFWLVAGLIWLIAVARHTIVNNDIIGALVYIAAAVLSFVLAFVYYKDFIK